MRGDRFTLVIVYIGLRCTNVHLDSVFVFRRPQVRLAPSLCKPVGRVVFRYTMHATNFICLPSPLRWETNHDRAVCATLNGEWTC
jgi:hypothetical protein